MSHRKNQPFSQEITSLSLLFLEGSSWDMSSPDNCSREISSLRLCSRCISESIFTENVFPQQNVPRNHFLVLVWLSGTTGSVFPGHVFLGNRFLTQKVCLRGTFGWIFHLCGSETLLEGFFRGMFFQDMSSQEANLYFIWKL